MLVREFVAYLETIAPPQFAEGWDNVGLLVGGGDSPVTKVLLTVDFTREVADEAETGRYDFVIAYHPPIFKPFRTLLSGEPVYRAVRAGIALYSPHTALDVAPGGTNDLLADAVGMVERSALRPAEAHNVTIGLGRIGSVAPTTRDKLIARVKKQLHVDHVLVAGPRGGEVKRVAVGAGSCGDLVDAAIDGRADVYVTGELGHHAALKAAASGMTVVAVLHSNSERGALHALAAQIVERWPAISTSVSSRDRDPFAIV